MVALALTIGAVWAMSCGGPIHPSGRSSGPQEHKTAPSTNCRSDADCEIGFLCALSSNGGCGPVYGYFCHTPSDECGIDSDCVGDQVIPTCVFSQSRGHCVCAEFDKGLCG